VAEKIRISGGGRCNFTNRDLDKTAPQRHYVGNNPQFCRSALARYTPEHFIALVQQHGIAFHEKHLGQLFCDESAEAIIAMLLAECAKGQVERWQPCRVKSIRFAAQGNTQSKKGSYYIQTQRGEVQTRSVVIATGGLSIPKIGATDFGYRIAQQFNVPVVEPRPGLVPLTLGDDMAQAMRPLAGVSLPTIIAAKYTDKKLAIVFEGSLLFTHKGISGPVVLQISNYWQPNRGIIVDFLPEIIDLPQRLLKAKKEHPKKLIPNILSEWMPTRFAEIFCGKKELRGPIGEASDKTLAILAKFFTTFPMSPTGTEGWRKAEVTIGGVDTAALSQKSMECKKQPGLYFIGEVVDITGWLGGYNFQWAWSSAYACAQALPKD